MMKACVKFVSPLEVEERIKSETVTYYPLIKLLNVYVAERNVWKLINAPPLPLLLINTFVFQLFETG